MESSHETLSFEKPNNDYLRVMTASPEVAIADTNTNTERIVEAYKKAQDQNVELICFPELSVTGYSTADLFFNQQVLDKVEDNLEVLAEATKDGGAMIVGAPLRKGGLLFNCGVVLADGKVVGAVPKSHLPNYNEFYEKRWFTSGKDIKEESIRVNEQEVPFGTDLLFDIKDTKVAIEICEDVFAVVPPSNYHALAGAEVVVNLSASNELIGKADYRRRLIGSQAANLVCAYLYNSAGNGESYSDVAYSGHQLIYELGRKVGEVKPFHFNEELVYDVDKTYIQHDRLVNKTYAEQAAEFRNTHPYRTIKANLATTENVDLLRDVDPAPFVPKNPETLDQRCEEIFEIMAHSLAQNVAYNNSKAIVLGLSGGLDSTLALLTAVEACKILGKPLDFIHTITMPGPASSERTQDNASLLAEAIGTTHHVMPIGELVDMTLARIGHDGVTEDITFENTVARVRKSLLEDYANKVYGLDLGTGDLSENAQGWCTFNGDHMSMFNPNGGVPKTLIKHLVRWVANSHASEVAKNRLLDILDTPISPELTGNGDLSQTTESLIGPYELHDFTLSQFKRYGTKPSKIKYLASVAFEGAYQNEVIDKWVDSFMAKFTGSQSKREVMPIGPKVGPVSLSPRGDHRMAPNTSRSWYTD